MQFLVLGPLRVVAGDPKAPDVLSAARLRTLLAVLLWRANQPVSVDELAEMVWDGVPPARAPEATRALVLRLRRALNESAAARILTRAPGYVIEVSNEELDAARFEGLTREAGAALRAGRWPLAAQTAAQALELWRGTPLLDVPSQALRDQWAPHLEQLHLQALEWRIEGDLHEGRHEQVVPELRDLAMLHPLRENFHGQLMLACYRSGHQSEALVAYRRAREVLAKELGIEPGPGLRTLHQRILAGDPALAASAPAQSTAAESPQVTPRELPPTVPGFTGRSAELGELTRLLDTSGGTAPGSVVVAVVRGTAGVGKTALAVHWAHQVAGRFPDGQLYVNLRGYDPEQPAAAGDALAGMLRSLGVRGPDVPPEPDDRAARYRSLLAGKRVLVVLDNAGSADQVRPLLPGSPGSMVVVTSRDALAGLVIRDGAARLDLGVLPSQEAVGLLRSLVGARADAEPGPAAELAEHCCRLPLALRVAAELAAARPATPLAELAGELANVGTRLDLLEAGEDERTQVRAVFSWSYRYLDATAARAFRLLGLHPGPDFEAYAVAALAESGVAQARQALDRLVRAHLVTPTGAGRWGMHDLLRGYARELAVAVDGEAEQRAATARLLDYYLSAAAAGMDVLFPAERHHRPAVTRPATPVPPLPDAAAARGWLERELPALVAAVAHAARERAGHATLLATVLSKYLVNSGHVTEALTVHRHALAAARRAGDRASEGRALFQLATVDLQLSRLDEAVEHYRQALVLFRAAGDRTGEARALGNTALTETQLARYDQAAGHHQQALGIFRDLGDRLGEARALSALGYTRQKQGRYAEAASCQRDALELSREVGDLDGVGVALARLGSASVRHGRYQQGADYLRQALAVFTEGGNTDGAPEVMTRLGEAYAGLGRHAQAVAAFGRALEGIREIGDPAREADALNGLAETLLTAGDAAQALAYHATALRLATATGIPQQQARAHAGLARASQADGHPAQARRHWQEALTRYTEIGAPEAREIRARLTAIAEADAHDERQRSQRADGSPVPSPDFSGC